MHRALHCNGCNVRRRYLNGNGVSVNTTKVRVPPQTTLMLRPIGYYVVLSESSRNFGMRRCSQRCCDDARCSPDHPTRLSFVAQALEMLHEAARLDDPDATFNLAQVRATATAALNLSGLLSRSTVVHAMPASPTACCMRTRAAYRAALVRPALRCAALRVVCSSTCTV